MRASCHKQLVCWRARVCVRKCVSVPNVFVGLLSSAASVYAQCALVGFLLPVAKVREGGNGGNLQHMTMLLEMT